MQRLYSKMWSSCGWTTNACNNRERQPWSQEMSSEQDEIRRNSEIIMIGYEIYGAYALHDTFFFPHTNFRPIEFIFQNYPARVQRIFF